jgi:RHS repeat-associated protein
MPWGESTTLTGTGFGYVGYWCDKETGLYYARARYYDPRLGRFLSTDPLGQGPGPNVYAYVQSDPLNLTDPNGRFFFLVTAAVGAAGGAVGDIVHQLYVNNGNFSAINYSEVGTAALVGGVAGAAAPFVATTYLGATLLGATANTAQYLLANGSNSTVGGAAFAGATGAIGGAIAGPISNPFMFIQNISPFSGSLTAAAANAGTSAFLRNTAGDIVSSTSPPAAAATSTNAEGGYSPK